MDDDADSKKPKPLTPRQRWKNITDALAEDALNDTEPLTAAERAQAERVKKKLLETARVEAPEWEQKEAKRKATAKPKYIN